MKVIIFSIEPIKILVITSVSAKLSVKNPYCLQLSKGF